MSTYVITKDKIHSFNSFKERVNVENVRVSPFIPVTKTVATTVSVCTSSPQPLAMNLFKINHLVVNNCPFLFVYISEGTIFSSTLVSGSGHLCFICDFY